MCLEENQLIKTVTHIIEPAKDRERERERKLKILDLVSAGGANVLRPPTTFVFGGVSGVARPAPCFDMRCCSGPRLLKPFLQPRVFFFLA